MVLSREQGASLFQVKLSPTQESFVMSNAVVPVLFGPMGEGKSYAGVIAMIAHAQRNGKPIRCAIIRDTHENIKTSTAVTIRETLDEIWMGIAPDSHGQRPLLYRFKNDFKELIIYSTPQIEVHLFGIDDEASYSKLQGPEYALIWLEEPAPIALKKNAGLPEAVFNLALSRCARQKGGVVPRLQVTMNPSDQDHWSYHRFILEKDVNPEYPMVTKAVYRIRQGENTYLSEMARQTTKAAYSRDKALSARYISGEFAAIQQGIAVAAEYNPETRRSKVPLIPAEGLVGFRAWDGWHSPTCLIGQITRTGRLIFLESLHIENQGDVTTLIDNELLPLMNTPRWKDKCKGWRDIGDFSMRIPDQSNRAETAAKVIERKLNTIFEPGPSRWENQKMGLKHALSHEILGKPAFILNINEHIVHRALSGGWHYPVDNSGHISSKLPDKNDSSHIGDAFSNAVNVLLPIFVDKTDRDITKQIMAAARLRAESYGGGVAG